MSRAQYIGPLKTLFTSAMPSVVSSSESRVGDWWLITKRLAPVSVAMRPAFRVPVSEMTLGKVWDLFLPMHGLHHEQVRVPC